MPSTAKITLLLFSLLFLVKCVVLLPARDNNFIQQEESCQSICKLCDCQGFYCGEECICECALKKPENLQCIADMKNDCDEAGLEYELLLQGPQGPRYLRDLNEYYTNNEEKPDHIILLKHKRQNNETTVSPTDDPIVGNAQETTATAGVIITSTTAAPKKTVFDFLLGNPQPAPALPNIQKVLLVLRERLAARRAPKPTTAPPPPTHAPIVAPKINHHHFVLPTLPQIKFTSKAPTKAPTKAPAPRTLFNKELVIERKVSLPVLPEHLRVRN